MEMLHFCKCLFAGPGLDEPLWLGFVAFVLEKLLAKFVSDFVCGRTLHLLTWSQCRLRAIDVAKVNEL